MRRQPLQRSLEEQEDRRSLAVPEAQVDRADPEGQDRPSGRVDPADLVIQIDPKLLAGPVTPEPLFDLYYLRSLRPPWPPVDRAVLRVQERPSGLTIPLIPKRPPPHSFQLGL